MVETEARPKRLTQEERSAATRERLLDATIQSLIDVGYARTTTTLVCEIAGLSRGAQLHHFHTKADLVTSALEHLTRKRFDTFREKLQAARAGGEDPESTDDPFGAGLELLWESIEGPLIVAAIELWIAARTDAELYERLLPLEREIGHSISEYWPGVSAGASGSPLARDLLQMSHHLLRGMVLQRILNPNDRHRRRQFELWKRIASGAHRTGRIAPNAEIEATRDPSSSRHARDDAAELDDP